MLTDPCAPGQLARGLGREYLASVMDLDDQAEPVVRVWSSPMRRCLQTAVPLAAALGCPSVVAEADICEVGGHHRATGEPPAPSGVDLAFEHSGFVDTSRLPGGLGSAQVRAVGPLLQPGGAAGLSASHGVCRGQQRGQPWWSAGDDSTAEGVEQAMRRAYRVGEEMLRVAQAGQTDVLVAVSHDGFVRLLDPRAGGSAAPRETYYELHSEPVAKVFHLAPAAATGPSRLSLPSGTTASQISIRCVHG